MSFSAERIQNERELEVEGLLGREDYGELNSPARVPEWEQDQEYSGDRTEVYGTGEDCPLDNIPFLPLDSEEENIHEKYDDHTIVEAVDLKGHSVRDMAIDNRHGELPSEEQKERYVQNLIEEASERVKREDIDYLVLHGNMSSIEDHYHALGSSLEENEQDLEAFQDYAVFRLEEEPVLLDHRIETTSGEVVFPSEEWLEENYRAADRL
ncbi:MAG: hypothetical protein V5A72_02705 [Candidatus Nanohaloarchaea archaeon]